MKPTFRALCAAAALLTMTGSAFGADPTMVSSGMTLTSSTFADNDLLDSMYAGKGGPRNCDGENVSPAFAWSRAPDGTKSFALFAHDNVGEGGSGVVHWVLYDIPPDATGFGEGEIPEGAREGKNITGQLGYLGPCPDVGDQPHHYEFMLIALDLAPGVLPAEMTGADFKAAIAGHGLGATSLVGRYARNP